MHSTIALLTDFGLEDAYVGIIKGVILSINPKVRLVDISHQVPAHDIFRAALLLKASYRYFPKGTIFLVVVDPGVGTSRKAIIVKTTHYTFVGPDNGVLSFTDFRKYGRVIEITKEKYFLKPVSNTFHGRDIFAPVAAHLSKGVLPAKFGPSQKGMQKLYLPSPTFDKKTNSLSGKIILIDRFGNLTTNIEHDAIEEFSGECSVFIKDQVISQISSSYTSAKRESVLAIINSMGYLEIAANNHSAQRILGAAVGDNVKVNFKA